MPNIEEADIIAGAECSFDSKGTTVKRRFKINGLTGTPPFVQYQAMIAAASVGAGYGSPHPAIPGIFCTSGKVVPFKDSRTSVYFDAMYEPPQKKQTPGQYKITVKGSSGQKTITCDRVTGALLTVTYLDANKKNVQSYSPYNILSPNTIITFEWISNVGDAGPKTLSDKYRRKLNKAAWNGYAAGTVLCREMDGTSSNSGFNYEMTASFEYDPGPDKIHNGWDIVQVFRDAHHGTVPAGIDTTKLTRANRAVNGAQLVTPFDDADFNALGFPAVT